MINLNTASILVSFIAFFISLYTLYIERIIIKIKSINLGIGGEIHPIGEHDKEIKHTISCVEVEVKNIGKKDAQKCEGLVTFKKMNPLTLHPAEKGNVLRNDAKFSILAGEKKNLVAAWQFSGKAIDGSAGLEKGDFLDKAPPIEVVIYFGEKTVRKSLSEKDIEKILRKNEEEDHKNV